MKHRVFHWSGIAALFLGFLFTACNEKEVVAEVEAQVIKPYVDLLLQEKFEDAYAGFTSDKYKKYNALDDYVKSYQANFEKRGPLEGFEKTRIHLIANLFGKDEVIAELAFKFKNDKYAKPVMLTISQNDQGQYKIDAGWFNKRVAVPDGLDGPF